MKRFLVLLLVSAAAFSVAAQESNLNIQGGNLNTQESLKGRLERHVHTLAADSLLGRRAGTGDSRRAALYIIRNFEEIGLKPFVGDSSYLQKFAVGGSGPSFANVIGYIEGSDPVLKEEYVVIGAHYDHLGFKKIGRDTVIYNGADDNASGTAAMLEIARALSARETKPARTVVFAAFDAEEMGLHGSRHMVSQLPPGKAVFMASVDMVGWLKAGENLKIAGVAMLDGGKRIMGSVPRPEGLDVELKKFDRMIVAGSDHDSFANDGVPAFHITTGIKSPYHKPQDTAEKIDYDGLVLVTEYLSDMTAVLASEPSLASSGRVSPKHSYNTVEFFVTASVGSNTHHYPRGALTGKSAFAWSAGFAAQFNLGGTFSVRPEALYQQRSARYPSDMQNIVLGADYDRFTVRSLTVPLNLLVRFPQNSPVYFYFNAGGYYSYNLSGSIGGESIDFDVDATRHEWGLTAGFGVQVGAVGIAFSSFNALSRVMTDGPTMKNRSSHFTVYYKF